MPKPREIEPVPVFHAIASYVYPIFGGQGFEANQSDLNTIFISNQTMDAGFDVHAMLPLFSIFYVSGGFSYFTEIVDFPSLNQQYTNFEIMDGRVGAGVVFRLGSLFQVYGGLGGVFRYLILGDLWNTGTIFWSGEDANGGGFFIESGVDMIFGDIFVLNVALQYVYADIRGTTIFPAGMDFSSIGVSAGLGMVF